MSASLIKAGNDLAAAVRNGSVGIVSAALDAWYEAAGSAEDITSGTEENPIGESGGVLMVGLDDDLDAQEPEGDVLVSDVEAAAVVEAAEARAEAEARTKVSGDVEGFLRDLSALEDEAAEEDAEEDA